MMNIKLTQAVKVILLIHGVGLLLSIFAPMFTEAYLSLSTGNLLYPVSIIWTAFTYQLVGNSSVIGVLFFALFMWWVGSRLEEAWGTKTFVKFYLTVTVIGGLVSFLILSLLNIGIVAGSFGLTFSIIAVFAYMMPNTKFYIFGIFPIKVKFLLLISIVLTLLAGNPTMILFSLIIQVVSGITAVIFMFIVFPLPEWLQPHAQGLKDWVEKRKKNDKYNMKREKFTVYTNNDKLHENARDIDADDEVNEEERIKEEVDRILDKISKYGIDALTKKEKKFLDEYGKKY